MTDTPLPPATAASGWPLICTFWHGPLTWLERLCLTSFVEQGHEVHLYAYDPVEGLPEGVGFRDAAAIEARDAMVFYKGRGTSAVFADRFRVRLLQAGAGTWADADVYCIAPFASPSPYLMGYEHEGSINSAVLRVPADAPLLEDLLSIFADDRRPLWEPHLPGIRRLEVAAKRLVGMAVPPEHMQYGATGPAALTYFVERRGLAGEAQPRDVFYPVPYDDIPTLMQAGTDIVRWVTPRTLAVHLWRSRLTDRGRAGLSPPAPGSALARLCEKHSIAY